MCGVQMRIQGWVGATYDEMVSDIADAMPDATVDIMNGEVIIRTGLTLGKEARLYPIEHPEIHREMQLQVDEEGRAYFGKPV